MSKQVATDRLTIVLAFIAFVDGIFGHTGDQI